MTCELFELNMNFMLIFLSLETLKFLKINQKSVKKFWRNGLLFAIFETSNKQKLSARILF
jgi:hypothetical protein